METATEYVPASPANMRKYPGLSALDRATGDVFSATAGDYFWQPDGEPLRDEDGEPLILVVRFPERHVPLAYVPINP